MANLGMRPRFALDVSCHLGTLVRKLSSRTAVAEPALEGSFDEGHCVVRIAEPRRTFWSPELDLTFEPVEEPGAELRVRGMFAPRPGVWTGFAFVYAVLFVAVVAGVLFGLAEMSLGTASSGLPVAGIALAAIGLIYTASFIGQALASDQMAELRVHLDRCVAEAEREEGVVEANEARQGPGEARA